MTISFSVNVSFEQLLDIRVRRAIFRWCIALKNFLSFDDEVQFDMFPIMRRANLSHHIQSAAGKLTVLKMAAIYGSNGAGKSNLVKALEFIKGICA